MLYQRVHNTESLLFIFFFSFCEEVLSDNKENTNGRPARRERRFGKNRNERNNPSNTVNKLATRTLMMEFRKASMSHAGGAGGGEQGRKKSNLLDSCEIDLSQCQCAKVCKQRS